MKKTDSLTEKDVIILTDILLRLNVIEKTLIDKGVTTPEEFKATMNDISRKIAKTLLQNANVPGDLDSIVDSFVKDKKSEN